MSVIISGKGIDIGDAFRHHIESHTQALIDKYFQNECDTHVTISKDGRHMITADINAHVGKGILLRSHVDSMDPYGAFDMALHKIEKRLRRYKNRLNEHHTKHDTQDQAKALNYILSHDFGHDENTVANENVAQSELPVIAEFVEDIPLLSVNDAVMRLDLSDQAVLLFKNINHGELNVVHRRHDGTIGWVDPKGLKDVRKIG